MTDLTEAIRNAPLASMIPLALLMIVGLLLWAAGRRLLRASFAAVGLVLGAGGGWLLGEAVNIGVPPGAIAIILGVVAACLAALVFRLALAMALGIVLAVAAPLGVITVAEMQADERFDAPPQEEDDSEATKDDDAPDADGPLDDVSKWLEKHSTEGESAEDARSLEETLLGDSVGISDEAQRKIDEARSFAGQITDGIKGEWQRTPDELRPLLVAAAIGGFLAGLLIGTLASSFTATLVSSVGGALLWLSCLRVLLLHFDDSIAQWLPSTALALTVTWLITSLLGMGIQWTFRPKKADKPA